MTDGWKLAMMVNDGCFDDGAISCEMDDGDDDWVGVDAMIASPVNVSSLESPVLTMPLKKIGKSFSLNSCKFADSKLMVGISMMLLLLSL